MYCTNYTFLERREIEKQVVQVQIIKSIQLLYWLALDTSTHFKNNNQEMATEKDEWVEIKLSIMSHP